MWSPVRSARASARTSARLAAAALLGVSMACSGNHGTIGALLGQQQDGRLFVREVPEDLAAARAGLRPNDEILLIDGRDVRDLTPKQIHTQLSGDVGQPVKLTVLRGEEVLRITLRRSPARKSPRLSAK
jgi:carboxyl-terminal processing protease